MLLYIDDSGPGAGTFKEARACGFETMSAITPTGTGQFPTSAQSSIGVGTVVIRKSATADATARPWTCIADGHTIYLFIESGDNTSSAIFSAPTFAFGDFFSYKSSDSYAVMILGRTLENSGNTQNDMMSVIGSSSGVQNIVNAATCIGHFIARSWTGTGGSIQFGKVIDQIKFGFSSAGGAGSIGVQIQSGTGVLTTRIGIGRNFDLPTGFPYPNGPDGAAWCSPIWLTHSGFVRGYFKGLWAPLHDRPFNHNDTITVSGGNLNAKSFVVQAIPCFANNVQDSGQILVETSDTWA